MIHQLDLYYRIINKHTDIYIYIYIYIYYIYIYMYVCMYVIENGTVSKRVLNMYNTEQRYQNKALKVRQNP